MNRLNAAISYLLGQVAFLIWLSAIPVAAVLAALVGCAEYLRSISEPTPPPHPPKP